MTLSISVNKKMVVVYAGISLFCFVFYLIYDRFSHGVHSPYMTWLFAWPLLLGGVPSLLFLFISRLPERSWLCRNLYRSGIAAVTVSSLLRGIFDIAGTASEYQQWLMWAGDIMLAGGVLVYLMNFAHVGETENKSRSIK